MRIYRIVEGYSEEQRAELAEGNRLLTELMNQLESKYSGLELFVSESINKIHIHELRVPLEMRHQGIGGAVIRAIQDFAITRGKPVTLAPQAERGYKKKLDNFYKGHGFVNNKGRNMDYSISEPFARTMYWRPQ